MASEPGIKKRVEHLLLACKDEEPLSMGQVMARANIPKTNASDVSSALHKLRGDGLIRAVRGPSSSVKGPKFVKLYQWVQKPVARRVEVVVVSPMAGLGIFRC